MDGRAWRTIVHGVTKESGYNLATESYVDKVLIVLKWEICRLGNDKCLKKKTGQGIWSS